MQIIRLHLHRNRKYKPHNFSKFALIDAYVQEYITLNKLKLRTKLGGEDAKDKLLDLLMAKEL